MSDFATELQQLNERLQQNRAGLQAALETLTDADLPLARRGGWSVARVLEHIIGAEWHYAQLVAHLRGLPPPANPKAGVPSSIDEAAAALEQSRAALTHAVEGVNEEDFYRLGMVGREEYSIVSVLENAEQHDAEHLGQIRLIQAGQAAPA